MAIDQPIRPAVGGNAIAVSLERHMDWLQQVLEARTNAYFSNLSQTNVVEQITAPELDMSCPMDRLIQDLELDVAGRLVLVLALVPQIRPQVLDIFFTKNTLFDRGYTEFGGIKGNVHGGFLPTGETAMFLLAGSDVGLRLQYQSLFVGDHPLFTHQVLVQNDHAANEPLLSFPLVLQREFLTYFLTGTEYKPDYSAAFPAKRINTHMDWTDLVLDDYVLSEVKEIQLWIDHASTIMEDWGLKKNIKPGFRSLFYGPPGTGKTLTATLLGKSTGRDVYRVDLSMIISKYIGETEKNLKGVFDQAAHKNWILFFDEADALFGKRTTMSSSHDRFANQEVSYLLQRIEDFPGIVILASNFKTNLDEAFTRRFQSIIHFPRPDKKQRKRLWELAFDDRLPQEEGIDYDRLAEVYELTGGEIVNVLRYAALKATEQQDPKVQLAFILEGVRRELHKEGRMFERF